MTSESKNGTLYIYPAGRIDSTNASLYDDEFAGCISGTAHTKTVIDCEKLDYVSSAGLRVILKLKKTEPSLSLVNVNPELYGIFEMTGFTELMSITKAYRVISIDGCEEIGKGANGKVYRLDPDTIIKVYSNPDSLPDIKRERELARRAFILGIPTAIPYDVVKVNDSYGSVFELLNARSFAKLFAQEPENTDKYVRMYIDLLKKIHSTKVSGEDMPDMKATALKWVEFTKGYLPAGTYDKLKALFCDIPTTDNMLHGDYHIKNVMLQNGEALLIDMDTLCVGHPVFELASMYNAYKGFYELDRNAIRSFLGIDYETSCRIWELSLSCYFGTDDKTVINEVENKAKLIGFIKILRRSIRRNLLADEAGQKAADYYISEICRLTELLDSLSF